jgi:two-component system response regulator AtoC
VANVAGSDIPVLVLGETGTGKRALAHCIHRRSAYHNHAFNSVRCAALGSDFFHRIRGNGPDAKAAPVPGTLYLEEIGDLSPANQPKILQALFNGGAAGHEGQGARLIASSRRNLEQEIQAGRFREDLYYRLSGVCLRVPPLRHRKEDIPLLIEHFLDKYALLFNRPRHTLSAPLLRLLLDYSWPGNVRELENDLKTIAAVGDERVVMAALRSAVVEERLRNGENETVSLKQAARTASRQAERELILKVLARTRWNRKRAAQELQISYKALLYKLKQIGLDDDFNNREEMTV